jgi:hypothetical protein
MSFFYAEKDKGCVAKHRRDGGGGGTPSASDILSGQQGEDEVWFDSYLIDQIHIALAKATGNSDEVGTTTTTSGTGAARPRKYLEQARKLLPVAFLGKSSFIINVSDLTPRIVDELSKRDADSRGYILRQAAGRIFEEVNFDLYHLIVAKGLRVRLEE